MISSYNCDIDKFVGEVGYRLEVVASSLGKMDRDKEKYQYDDSLTQSTLNQIDFLEGKSLSEEIPVSEYSNAINLYHDVLESLLADMKSDKKYLKDVAMDKYQRLRQSLDSEIGTIEHELILSDVPHLLNDMYNVVKGRPKKNYFKDL